MRLPARALDILPGPQPTDDPTTMVGPNVMKFPVPGGDLTPEDARKLILVSGTGPVNGGMTVSGVPCPADVLTMIVPPPACETREMIVLFRPDNPRFSPITNKFPRPA